MTRVLLRGAVLLVLLTGTIWMALHEPAGSAEDQFAVAAALVLVFIPTAFALWFVFLLAEWVVRRLLGERPSPIYAGLLAGMLAMMGLFELFIYKYAPQSAARRH